MKTRVFLCIAIGIVGSIFMGCQSNKDWPDKKSGDLIVMKFVQPEYKNYVLANYKEGDDHISMYAVNRCGESIGLSGNSPYWDLFDNWLLIDWKWWGLPYKYKEGLTLLTEQKWDNYDLSAALPKWSLTEPHTFEPVAEIYYLSLDSLEKYTDGHYDSQTKELVRSTHALHNASKDQCMCEKVETMDSIWTVLQRDLSAAIENGDLEHINDDKYNPYK